MTPTGQSQKVLSQQNSRAGRRALPRVIRITQSAVCSQSHSQHHASDTALISTVMQPRDTGPRNLRNTHRVSALSELRLELNAIYWRMFGGSSISHSLSFSKEIFLQMGARIGSPPFPPVIPEAHTFGLLPWIIKKAKVALQKGLHKSSLPHATHSLESLKIT